MDKMLPALDKVLGMVFLSGNFLKSSSLSILKRSWSVSPFHGEEPSSSERPKMVILSMTSVTSLVFMHLVLSLQMMQEGALFPVCLMLLVLC